MNIGLWDILLILIVSCQCVLTGYLYQPKLKAFIWTLPIPFTLASMALGTNINVTNMTGVLLILLFAHMVRILHYNKKLPILIAIVLSALGYCVLGTTLAPILPKSALYFWITTSIVVLLGLYLFLTTPARIESGHRTPLPVWKKLPTIMLVIIFLVFIKSYLQGFMTVFPMVGVITAYEARHSLWTLSRQIPVMMLTFPPFMVTCRLLYPHLGLGLSLFIAWLVFVAVLIPVTRLQWAAQKKCQDLAGKTQTPHRLSTNTAT